MKQIIWPILGVMVFIILVGSLTQKNSPINLSKYLISATPAPAKTVTINDKNIQVEVANTNQARTKGLSGRSSLDENSGLIFTFESRGTYPKFWMKDMLIPIDIIWITDGKIIKIDSSVPPPTKGIPDNKLTIYSPGKPIDYVLEVNAGYCDKNDINVGDGVKLPDSI